MPGEGGEKPQPKVQIKHGLNQARVDQVLQTPHPYQGPSVIDTAQDVFNLMQSLRETVNNLKNEKKINPLTKLPNREALDEFIGIFDNKPGSMVATYIDLKGFGEINRNIGHTAADQKIRDFSSYFKSQIRENDFLFHLHGDEFVLLSAQRINPNKKNNSQEGLKHRLEIINENSEVKFDFVSVTYSKDKHRSLADTINDADLILMERKKVNRGQDQKLYKPILQPV